MYPPIVLALSHKLAWTVSENKTSAPSLGGPRYEKRKNDGVAFNLQMDLIAWRRLLTVVFLNFVFRSTFLNARSGGVPCTAKLICHTRDWYVDSSVWESWLFFYVDRLSVTVISSMSLT